jgi:hypothetical protein
VNARPHDVAFLVELADHADMEHEADAVARIDMLIVEATVKAERAKELQQSYRVLERLRNEAWQEIARVNDELADINRELKALGRTAK